MAILWDISKLQKNSTLKSSDAEDILLVIHLFLGWLVRSFAHSFMTTSLIGFTPFGEFDFTLEDNENLHN